MFRNLVERSNMSNNDEYSLYTETELLWQDPKTLTLLSKALRTAQPYLVISRPVFDFELEDGLGIGEGVVNLWEEDVPRVTRFLDSLYRFKTYLEAKQELAARIPDDRRDQVLDPTYLLKNYVACNFYDCMSGGMPNNLVSLVRFIMEQSPNIDWDVETYPRSESAGGGWYTLRDFYRETADCVRWEDVVSDIGVVGRALPCKVVGFLTA